MFFLLLFRKKINEIVYFYTIQLFFVVSIPLQADKEGNVQKVKMGHPSLFGVT